MFSLSGCRLCVWPCHHNGLVLTLVSCPNRQTRVFVHNGQRLTKPEVIKDDLLSNLWLSSFL